MINSNAIGPLTIRMTCWATVSSGVPLVAANTEPADPNSNVAPRSMEEVYQSLIRPKLRRGGEWKLTTAGGLIALMMLVATLVSHVWWLLGVAAFLYWPVQWVFRAAAKHDPQWYAVYTRALRQPLVREPNGDAHLREATPYPAIPPFPKWLK
jgi:type IV secretory pathway TrbD component